MYQAISTLEKVRFTTDSTGQPLADPVDFLLAGVWKRGLVSTFFHARPLRAGPKFPFPGRRMRIEALRFGHLHCIRTRSPAAISSLPG